MKRGKKMQKKILKVKNRFANILLKLNSEYIYTIYNKKQKIIYLDVLFVPKKIFLS
jgi:hypothetical protein